MPPARRGAALSHLFSVADWWHLRRAGRGPRRGRTRRTPARAAGCRCYRRLTPSTTARRCSTAARRRAGSTSRERDPCSAVPLYKLVVGEQILCVHWSHLPELLGGHATYEWSASRSPSSRLKVLGEQVNFSKARRRGPLWLRDRAPVSSTTWPPTRPASSSAPRSRHCSPSCRVSSQAQPRHLRPRPRRRVDRRVLRGLRNGGYYGPFVDVGDYYSPVPPPTPAQKAAQEKFNATIQRQNRPAEKAAIAPSARWSPTRTARSEEDRPVPVKEAAYHICVPGLLAWLVRPYRILSKLLYRRSPASQLVLAAAFAPAAAHHCRIRFLWRPLHSPLATMPAQSAASPQTSASRRPAPVRRHSSPQPPPPPPPSPPRPPSRPRRQRRRRRATRRRAVLLHELRRARVVRRRRWMPTQSR